MDINEVNLELKKLPKDEMMMLMRFRLISPKKKLEFIMDQKKKKRTKL